MDEESERYVAPNVPKLSRGDGEAGERVRCSRGFGGLAIDIPAIGDPHDEDDQLVIGDGVDDPISPNSYTVAVALAGELFAPDGRGSSASARMLATMRCRSFLWSTASISLAADGLIRTL